MKRLEQPSISADELFDACISGISNPLVKLKYISAKSNIQKCAVDYEIKAASGNLWQLAPHPTIDSHVVFGGIRRVDLIKLYEYYLLNKSHARSYYDKIMHSANEECPFCGGLGVPHTLDHFLPKNKFSQFSVFIGNLIPCCRDCNMGEKTTVSGHSANTVFLHPIFDNHKYFSDQWVFAKYTDTGRGMIEYYPDPPSTWDNISRDRAVYHFSELNLAHRYRIRAIGELTDIHDALNNDIDSVVKPWLTAMAKNEGMFPNHWKRVMYQALHQHYVNR